MTKSLKNLEFVLSRSLKPLIQNKGSQTRKKKRSFIMGIILIGFKQNKINVQFEVLTTIAGWISLVHADILEELIDQKIILMSRPLWLLKHGYGVSIDFHIMFIDIYNLTSSFKKQLTEYIWIDWNNTGNKAKLFWNYYW